MIPIESPYMELTRLGDPASAARRLMWVRSMGLIRGREQAT